MLAFIGYGATEPRPGRDQVTRAGMPIELMDEDRFCDLSVYWVCVDSGPRAVPEFFVAT